MSAIEELEALIAEFKKHGPVIPLSEAIAFVAKNEAITSAMKDAVERLERTVPCSECGDIYEAKRKPSEGRGNYCARCAEIIERQRKREWARREADKRSAMELRALLGEGA